MVKESPRLIKKLIKKTYQENIFLLVIMVISCVFAIRIAVVSIEIIIILNLAPVLLHLSHLLTPKTLGFSKVLKSGLLMFPSGFTIRICQKQLFGNVKHLSITKFI